MVRPIALITHIEVALTKSNVERILPLVTVVFGSHQVSSSGMCHTFLCLPLCDFFSYF